MILKYYPSPLTDDGDMPNMRISPLTALAAIPAFILTANAASRMMQSSSAALFGTSAAANIQKKMDSEAAKAVYKAVLDSVLDRMLSSQQIKSKNLLALRNSRSHFVSAQGVSKLDLSQALANLEDASMPASARFLRRLNE